MNPVSNGKMVHKFVALCFLAGAAQAFVSCGETQAPSAAFTPASGPVGTLVTLTGDDFTTLQSVTIGGVAAIPISTSSTSMVAYVMPGAATGPINVTTSVGGALTVVGNFTVTATGVPSSTQQQGAKLIGTGAVSDGNQGFSVSLSADGNTALVGGEEDNSNSGAAWVFTRSGGAWVQQGDKLVGTGTTNVASQGYSVSLSADGNTALVGGPGDGSNLGAAWVYTRSGGVWTQQGSKLVGSGSVGLPVREGNSVRLSADGNTAIIGGPTDNGNVGAAWVFTRTSGVWTQQGSKLVGTGAVGAATQGSVALSADGNTAAVGGSGDNSGIGAVWVFTRSGGVWTQQNSKLIGSGTTGTTVYQGLGLSLSADGNTVVFGGPQDNSGVGATWVFTRSGTAWTQQGTKLLGSGATGAADQGGSLSLSADGNTVLIGGDTDNASAGAAWVFTRSGSTWAQQGSKLVGSGVVGGAAQANGVSLSADGSTACLGGPGDNTSVGASWIFL